MKKKALLALMLAVVMLTSGCALIEKDTEKDNATAIITVGDTVFTKAQVTNALNYQLNYMYQLYSAYGLSYDPTNADTRSEMLDTVINSMVSSAVTAQKATELGMDVFTADEEAEIQTTAQTNYDNDKATIKTQDFADTTLTGDELEAALNAKMEEYGATLDTYVTDARTAKANEKLRQSVIADVAVTEDELKAGFDEKVTAAQETYTNTLSSYGYAVNNKQTVYTAPAGYRNVKHILRTLLEDDSAKISDLNSQITAKNSTITTLNSELSAIEDTDENKDARAAKQGEITTAEAELADLNAQLTAAKETAYANLAPTVQEIQDKLAAGEDFDALMAEYGQDPGMQSDPAMTTGYAVCEGYTYFDTAFTAGAMALAKVGDVSEPIQGTNGIHIIKYVSDVTEGPVDMETVRETLTAELLATKQDDTYNAQVEEWVAAANAKIDKTPMAD